MRSSRCLIAVIVLSTASVLGLGLAPADAASGDQIWSSSVATATKSSSTVSATWNPVSYSLSLTVSTGALAAGKCVTVYFDWTAKGHHDARALRDCLSADTVTFAFPDATPSNITGGPDKLGICYAPDDKKGVCDHAIGTEVPSMDFSPWPDFTRATPCDLSWARRNVDGTVSSYLDPHSQQSKTVTPLSC